MRGGLLLLEPFVASSRHVSFQRAAGGPTAQSLRHDVIASCVIPGQEVLRLRAGAPESNETRINPNTIDGTKIWFSLGILCIHCWRYIFNVVFSDCILTSLVYSNTRKRSALLTLLANISSRRLVANISSRRARYAAEGNSWSWRSSKGMGE